MAEKIPTIISPREGESVKLLRAEHLRFLEEPQVDVEERLDWKTMEASGTDFTSPLPVKVRYLPEIDADVYLSLSPTMEYSVISKGVGGKAEFINLFIGRRYYLRAESTGGCSRTISFDTDSRPPRLMKIAGMYNFRDLGGRIAAEGKKVRQGLIYRGCEPNGHTDIEENGIKELMHLGLMTELDLRGIGDQAQRSINEISYVNIPIRPYSEIFEPRIMIQYRRLFRFLLDESAYPLFFHCWGGADRTGTLAFLICGLLGVPEDDLIMDYEFTSFMLWGKRSRYLEVAADGVRELKRRYGE
ncbi:MAG: tyrosine-protein phosphatase, partial [Clostridiales bacterium]|nr:tyrosine-protein phosphatase [Clostridiales bacterium]